MAAGPQHSRAEMCRDVLPSSPRGLPAVLLLKNAMALFCLLSLSLVSQVTAVQTHTTNDDANLAYLAW
jgi:hypothetical protein